MNLQAGRGRYQLLSKPETTTMTPTFGLAIAAFGALESARLLPPPLYCGLTPTACNWLRFTVEDEGKASE